MSAHESRRRGVTVVNSARMPRDPSAVFELVADPEREAGWNPKLLRVDRLTAGRVVTGSRYRARFPFPVGESTISYDHVDPPRSWRTHSTARWLEVEFLGRIAPTDDGCELTVSTTLYPRGPLRPLGRVVAATMKDSWEQHLKVIRQLLESHPPEPG